ncbi:hypothetical protein ACXYMX_16045 [Sporosarcina sp. CAU 1771]
MKKNKVANILFIIGLLIIAISFIYGLVIGQELYGDGMHIIWSIVFTYWFSGIVSGMLFIGLAEIIEILDTKLSWIQRRMTDEDMDKVLPVNDIKEGVIDSTPADEQSLTKSEEQFVREYFERKEIAITKVVKSPIEGICLVEFPNGKDRVYEIDGFNPEEIPFEKWDMKLKAWYGIYTQNKNV